MQAGTTIATNLANLSGSYNHKTWLHAFDSIITYILDIGSNPVTSDDESNCITVVSHTVSGGGAVSADISLCLIHGRDSGQPQLCGPQSSGE